MDAEPNPSDLVRGLAEAVREALREAQIPQRVAAERAGIPVATLHRRLNTSSPFRSDELAALADVAGTTVSALALRAEGRAA
jgi:hypothetical protein